MPRTTPNPASKLLSTAVVGGAGLELPPDLKPPAGMAAIVLFVPARHVVGMSPPQLQADLGLPWSTDDGEGVWFDEMSRPR
jgi:hypothetical protein